MGTNSGVLRKGAMVLTFLCTGIKEHCTDSVKV